MRINVEKPVMSFSVHPRQISTVYTHEEMDALELRLEIGELRAEVTRLSRQHDALLTHLLARLERAHQ